VTLLDDFLAANGDAADRHSASLIAQLSIADQLKLSHHLIESVTNALFGVQDSDDEDDGEDYECVEDEDD
jgi:hypothetical protein